MSPRSGGDGDRADHQDNRAFHQGALFGELRVPPAIRLRTRGREGPCQRRLIHGRPGTDAMNVSLRTSALRPDGRNDRNDKSLETQRERERERKRRRGRAENGRGRLCHSHHALLPMWGCLPNRRAQVKRRFRELIESFWLLQSDSYPERESGRDPHPGLPRGVSVEALPVVMRVSGRGVGR